jgi:heat-inducible transcriptional repressor
MTSLPVTELTARAREIFRRVVEEYIESGQPVGSKTLAADGTLNLSPASIRSVLADLETAGLLAAPHTSAGRLPTDAGLRIFVDGMMRVAEPTLQEQAAIEARLAEAGPVEAALAQASAILSDLSGAAGMVLVAPREQRLAQFSLVDLGQGRALAVLVGEDGGIENRVVPSAGRSARARSIRRATISPHASPDERSPKPRRRCAPKSMPANRSLMPHRAIWSNAGLPYGARMPPRARC